MGQLTPRQNEVLYLLAMGCANKEIASRLGISAATIKRHVTDIYAALGVAGRIPAVILWYRHAAQMGEAVGPQR